MSFSLMTPKTDFQEYLTVKKNEEVTLPHMYKCGIIYYVFFFRRRRHAAFRSKTFGYSLPNEYTQEDPL